MPSITRALRQQVFTRTLLLVVVCVLIVGGAAAYGLRIPIEQSIATDAALDAVTRARPRILRILTPADLAQPITGERYQVIDQAVRNYVLDPHVLRVKVWNPSGTTVYSTMRAQVGESIPGYAEVAEAMSGKVIWEVTESSESPTERDLGTAMEIYAPLEWGGEGPQGVLEIYMDYSHHAALLSNIQRAIGGAVLLVSVSLAVGFAVLHRTGSGAIRRQRDTATQHAERAEALVSIAGALAQPGSLEKRSAGALEYIARAVEADLAALVVVDEEARTRVIAEVDNRRPDSGGPAGWGLGGTISRLPWRRDQPVVVNDYPSLSYASERLVAQGIKSLVVAPIPSDRLEEGIVGLAVLCSREPGHFTPERVHLLSAVLEEIGVFWENAQLHQRLREELEGERKRLEAVRQIARTIALEEAPEEAPRRAVDAARLLVGAKFGALCMYGTDGQVTTWITSGALPEGYDTCGPPADVSRILKPVLAEQRSLRLGLLPTRSLYSDAPYRLAEIQSFLAAPVSTRNGHHGALWLVGKVGAREFSKEDERQLNLFAVTVEVLLDNAELYAIATREREALAAIQASMTEGLFVVDAQGRVAYVNQAAADYMGLPLDELQGRPLEELAPLITPRAEPPEAVEKLSSLFDGSTPLPASVEITLREPRRRDFLVTAFPIKLGASQQMVGLLARDITQEKELDRRKDAFIAVASHELRTPMTTILGFAELLLTRDVPESQRREWLQLIHQETQRLAAILDDMLSISRVQAGRLSLQPESLDLRTVVEAVLVMVRPMSKGHEFVVELPPDLPETVADRGKVAQVLLNLLTNAVKYSPKGGRITISARHDADPERIVVSVADQGMGIAKEDAEQLFTTFHRIQRPETRGIRGTGLGLYIVKQLVEMMGGEVWVESELNRGSTFSFSLPLRPSTQAGTGRDGSVQESAPAGRRRRARVTGRA